MNTVSMRQSFRSVSAATAARRVRARSSTWTQLSSSKTVCDPVCSHGGADFDVNVAHRECEHCEHVKAQYQAPLFHSQCLTRRFVDLGDILTIFGAFSHGATHNNFGENHCVMNPSTLRRSLFCVLTTIVLKSETHGRGKHFIPPRREKLTSRSVSGPRSIEDSKAQDTDVDAKVTALLMRSTRILGMFEKYTALGTISKLSLVRVNLVNGGSGMCEANLKMQVQSR